MTTDNKKENDTGCPVEGLLKMLTGKWKPQIFRLATNSPVRFSTLLRQLEGSNKQSLSIALKELEQHGLLKKKTVKQKPLHIEYSLTPKGQSLIPVFQQLESALR